MKKKIAAVAIVVLLIAGVFAGSTMAYFTKKVETHNVITSGNVDIIVENGENEFSNILPGQKIEKKVTEKNVGTGAAWVRAKVVKEIKAGSNTNATLAQELVTITYNTEKWISNGEWYYYNTVLSAPAEGAEPVNSEPFITEVAFSEAMDNNWQSAEVTVSVFVEAVQVKNNGVTYSDAKGWPETP